MSAAHVQFSLPESVDRERFIHPFDRVELIRYLEQLRLAYGTVRLLGLPDVDERNDDLPLRSLFVEPRLGEEPLSSGVFDEKVASRATKPLLEVLAREPRLVILGDPGAGKSTVVNWLCTALAQPMDNEVIGTLGRRVPLPFILRDLPLGESITWEDLLEQFLESDLARSLKKDPGLVNQLLESGQAIILLDGIDEIGSIERRKALRSAVWQGWNRWPRCQWVLTSRIVGYDEAQFRICSTLIGENPDKNGNHIGVRFSLGGVGLSGHLKRDLTLAKEAGITVIKELQSSITHCSEFYISPFSDGQVRQFIENWFDLRESNRDLARETTQNLLEALAADAATMALARTPNLLTLITLIYRVRAKLPDGRAELYHQIAQAYLKTIDEFRKLSPQLPAYSFNEKMEWLSAVGWRMQQARAKGESRDSSEGDAVGEQVATTSQVLSWLKAAMLPRFGRNTEVEATQFLDYVQRRTGLLLERGEGRFAFLHLSFQEFFSAQYLASRVVTPTWAMENLGAALVPGQSSSESVYALREYCGMTLWQETLVFLFELLPREWVEPIIKLLFPEKSFEVTSGILSLNDRARWLLGSRLAGDPHVVMAAQFREDFMVVCWRWELIRHSYDKGDHRADDDAIIARQLLTRQDTSEFGWFALTQAFDGLPLQDELDLNGCSSLTDISALGKIPRLKSLSLEGWVALRDVATLGELSNLRHLSLGGCSLLEDIDPLGKLKRLEILYLNDCRSLQDINGIRKLHGLKTLILDRCNSLVNLKPLSGLHGLDTISVDGMSGLRDLSAISCLSELRTIYANFCSALESLDGIDALAKLNYLFLDGCEGLANLMPIVGLRELRTLSLDFTRMSDLSPLSEVVSLQTLYLCGCPGIFDVSPVGRLLDLGIFYLTGNKGLVDIGPLKSLQKLEVLFIDDSPVVDLRPLDNLSNLHTLSLRGCSKIKTLEPIEKLPKLRKIYLSGVKGRFSRSVSRLQKRGVQVF